MNDGLVTDQTARHYTSLWPQALYRAEDVRELDRIAINQFGMPGFALMSAAGLAAFQLLQDRWPEARSINVFCGVGNNGGDGFIIASLAKRSGLPVKVILLGDAAKLKGDALLAYQQCQGDKVAIVPFEAESIVEADVVVDALLGTGLSGSVRADHKSAISTINRAHRPTLGIDIPSGLCANTGRVLGAATRCDATITFIGMKRGLLTHQGPDCTGDLFFADLEVPSAVYDQVDAGCLRVQVSDLRHNIKPRLKNTHKGNCGHVLIVGGDYGMAGAAVMAAEAAARSGAGFVSVATREAHVMPIISRRPEVMVRGCAEGDDISDLLEKATVIVAGPGLGRGSWGAFLLEQVLESDKAVVLDADGLNYLSVLAEQEPERVQRGNWVLTPHPGEAARLLGLSSKEIQDDRFAHVVALQQRYSGAVILKGNGTLIAGGGPLQMVTTGNPGMASGGMGDVLSGVVGGLLAQGLALETAAMLGAWVHGAAADKAVENDGERGLLATDLLPFIRQGVNGVLPCE